MKEKPLLLSGSMVRAILNGRKTQTRRVVNFGRARIHGERVCCGTEGYSTVTPTTVESVPWTHERISHLDCPYGTPGDRLWVRETWRPYSWHPQELTVQMRADDAVCDIEVPDTDEAERWLDRICEDAAHDCQKQAIQEEDGMYVWDGKEESPIRWRSSIFMPRFVSRITLEITEVRVERLQEITSQDAIAEGIEGDGNGHYANYLDPADDARIGMWMGPQSSYSTLWESIHGKKHPWLSNPWVWVMTFKVLTDGL